MSCIAKPGISLIAGMYMVLLCSGPATAQYLDVGQSSSTQCNVYHAIPFSAVPPIDDEMPGNIAAFYNRLDSLCKLFWPGHQPDIIYSIYDSLSETESRHLLQAIFDVTDYDPQRFLAYNTLAKDLDTSYAIKPKALIRTYKSKCLKMFGGASNPALYLAFSDGVFHIEVVDIYEDTVIVKGAMGERNREVVCITAKVLSSIKGEPLTEDCSNPDGDEYQCIRFSYAKDWLIPVSSNLGKSTDVGVRYPTVDSGSEDMAPDILYARYGNMPVPQPGERYIVFLEMDSGSGVDGDGIPYNLFLQTRWERRGGIFLVDDGIVWDPQKYFGLGKQIPIEEFLAHLNTIIKVDIRGNSQ